MENVRLVLVILLSFIALLLWEAWQKDFATPPPATDQAPLPTAANDVPPVATSSTGTVPKSLPGVTPTASSNAPLLIETDLYKIEINLTGGVIQRLELKKYPISVDPGAPPYALLANDPDRVLFEQSGLKTDGDQSPDHYAHYTADATSFVMADDANTLQVDLHWQSPTGVIVTKRWTFTRDNYVIGQTLEIHNGSDAEWRGHPYNQLQRVEPPKKRSMVPTFTGAALSSPEKRYHKFKFKDLHEEPINQDITGGWVALVEHYFVAALLPDPAVKEHYYSTVIDGNRAVVGYYGPSIVVPPGETRAVSSRMYIGPKAQEILPGIAPGLELTVDYGVLWFIAKILFWTLERLHGVFGNWGVAIILLTMSVKLLFYPLSAAGYRSMAKMRKVQPRLVALKERYGDDRARMNQAMMDLYKQERINPLGGCLPIVVQIPVFISLYWVLLESIELRQAPFFLWIHDLSIKDPYFVLPVLMTLSMWLQTRMNPAPIDPIQAKVMQFMPLIFGVFFAFFPAGLVLYWFVNNVLSIAQQWHISRQIEQPAT